MTRKTYKLPPSFWFDHHTMRGNSQSAIVERETKTYVLVSLDDAAYADLRSDCEFYVSEGRAGSFEFETAGLVRSAQATLRRLDADPFETGGRVKQRYVFSNPNPDTFPRTIRADAYDEAGARRIIGADLAFTRDWPIVEEAS